MCSPSISMREIRDAVYIKVDRKDDVMCFNLYPSVLRQNNYILAINAYVGESPRTIVY